MVDNLYYYNGNLDHLLEDCTVRTEGVFVNVLLTAIIKMGLATTSRDTTDYDLSGLYS